MNRAICMLGVDERHAHFRAARNSHGLQWLMAVVVSSVNLRTLRFKIRI